jgi:hypothetical protein
MVTIIDLYKEVKYNEVSIWGYLLLFGPYLFWLLPLIYINRIKNAIFIYIINFYICLILVHILIYIYTYGLLHVKSGSFFLIGFFIFGIPWIIIHAIGLLVYFIRRYRKERKGSIENKPIG